MKKLVMFVATLSLALAAAGFALAHNPPSGSGSECDTWSRVAHPTETPTPRPTQPSHHNEDHPGAVNRDNLKDVDSRLPDVPLPNNTTTHQSTGHYMVQTGSTRSSYVEVVGGGVYEGEPYYQRMGEGGYVQGRVDGSGTPLGSGQEVDFHVNTFGPISEPPSAPLTWQTHAEACVSYNNMKVQPTPQGTATPGVTVACPVPGVPEPLTCR